MCGIAGFNFQDERKIREIVRPIDYRGPDQEGFYTDFQVSLGHKRLSILDLSEKGRQPMVSTDGNFVIVYNGEIFNFSEIKKDLESHGYKFNSCSDTEVVLNAYINMKADCLKQFNGQFAFCIYDRVKGELFLARDQIGIKPLYYYFDGKHFVFGSELKVILTFGIKKEIDKQSLQHYLLFGVPPKERAIVKGVKKLMPGHYLVFSLKENQISEHKQYWQVKLSNVVRPSKDVYKKLYGLIDGAVKKQMIADVPVGAFLSGGLDSSIICYLMKQYNHNLKTFSIKFDYADFNETKWSRLVAEQLQTDHYEVEFDASTVKKLMPDIIDASDEPFGDPSIIPMYLLSKVAKEHVTVCLSGTGADELFVGYPRYKQFLLLRKFQRLPHTIKQMLIRSYCFANLDRGSKMKQLFKSQNDAAELYLKLFSYLYRGDEELGQSIDDVAELKHYFQYDEDLHSLLNFDQSEYLPNDLLVKEDRATMAVSLEGRVPFLDHELIEYVNSIDLRLKFRHKESKHLLKEIFKNKLPKEILYRKKRGFSVPLRCYFRKELRDFAHDAIFEFDHYVYYEKDRIKEMWEKHQRGESDYSHLFWVLISFNLWYRRWMLS